MGGEEERTEDDHGRGGKERQAERVSGWIGHVQLTQGYELLRAVADTSIKALLAHHADVVAATEALGHVHRQDDGALVLELLWRDRAHRAVGGGREGG